MGASPPTCTAGSPEATAPQHAAHTVPPAALAPARRFFLAMCTRRDYPANGTIKPDAFCRVLFISAKLGYQDVDIGKNE
jgi:hypothetical protein